MVFNIETCREHLDAWLKSELAVCNGQSYSIAGRTLTRANLSSIKAQIDYWKSELAKANNIEKRRGRNRVFRIVPRDL